MDEETKKLREEIAKGRNPVDILIDLLKEHNRKIMEKQKKVE